MQRINQNLNALVWEQIDLKRDYHEHGIIKSIGVPVDSEHLTVVNWAKDQLFPWVQEFRAKNGELCDFLTFAFRDEEAFDTMVGGPVLIPMPVYMDKGDYAAILRKASADNQFQWVINCYEVSMCQYKEGDISDDGLSYREGVLPPSERPDSVDALFISIDTQGYTARLMCTINTDGTYGDVEFSDTLTPGAVTRGRMTGLAGGPDPSTVPQA